MGLVLVFTGVLAFIVTRQWLTALALIVTGWCLQSASGTIRRQASLAMALEGTRARDLMSGDYTTVNSQATIGQLYREYILVSGWRFFAVTDGEAVKGFLTERRIRSVPWKRRNSTCAGDIMLPLDRASAIGPGQSGASALQVMEQLKINELPVIEYGVVVGIISRDRLVRLGRTRAEFGI
jgi:CBS domain-containing protein